jgi:hypothetical protein
MEEVLGNFFNNIDTSEYETINREEDDDESSEQLSPMDRIRGLNLPRSHFEHFFMTIKSSRPQLYRSIFQHSLFNAPTKPKKRKSKRDKKRERREKKAAEGFAGTEPSPKAQVPEDRGSESDSVGMVHSKSEEAIVSLIGPERKRDVTVTLFVAKCVAEGSINSILLAILFLIHLFNTENDIDSFSLPLSGVINALLGISSKDGKVFQSGKDSTDTSLRKYALTSKNLSFRADSVSEASGDNSRSVDEASLIEDGISQADSYFHSAYSETGSTIGSVTVEVGAEVASLDYEISEEEMLAQALALSLIVESTPKEAAVAPPSLPVASPIDPIKQREKLPAPPVQESKAKLSDERPAKKVPTDPMSTFGPLESPEAFDDVDFDTSTNLSVLSVIVALLIALSANCDRIMGNDPSPELVQLTDSFQLVHKAFKWSSKSIMELTFQPNNITFQSIEYLIEVFTEKICRELKPSIQPVSRSKYRPMNLQTLSWCLISSTRILKGHLYQTQLCGSTLSILTAGSVSELAFAISFGASPPLANSTPLMTRLVTHLTNLMHLDMFKVEDKTSSIGNAFQTINRVEVVGGSDRQYDNLAYFHHAIRIESMSAFVTAFGIFCPHSSDRECLIRNLLTTPIDFSSRFNHLTMNSYPKSKEFPNEYYQTWLLQVLCLAESKYGNCFMLSENFDKNIHSLSLLDAGNYETMSSESIGFSTASSPTSAQESSKVVFLHSPFSVEDNEKFLDSVNTVIMKRFKASYADHEDHYHAGDFFRLPHGSAHVNSRCNSLFYGEYCYLFSYQQHLSQKILDLTDSKDRAKDGVLRFASKPTSSYLSFNDDDKNVAHKGPRMWITASAQRGFAPNTGIHEILFRVDKCDRGQVFLGLSTADKSLSLRESYYLGCDHASWGLMGNGTLWHNRMKLKSEYGSTFNNRTLMKMRYDSNHGILSYSFGDANWGIAFANLPKETLYASVSLHEKDDKISILGWNVVPEEKRDASTAVNNRSSESMARAHHERHDLISFVRYSQVLLSLSEELLVDFEAQTDLTKRLKTLTHPYFGVFIPSISSALLLSKAKGQHQNMLSFQLLAYLIVFAKRVHSIYEMIPDAASPFAFALAAGDWKFRCGSSSSYPSQEYSIKFDEVFPIEGKDQKNDMLPVRITGSGKGLTKSVSVVGSQYGCWLKFVENWESSGSCYVDGKISLCGTFFNGKYSDASGKSGSLDGLLVSTPLRANSKHMVFKVLTLLTMCCGKLSGSFIVGAPTLEEEVLPTTPKQEASEDVDPGLSASEVEPSNVGSTKQEIDRWIQSNLFSNGFVMDEDFMIRFFELIEPNFPFNQTESSSSCPRRSILPLISISELNDLAYSYGGISQWWLSNAFPSLFAIGDEAKGRMEINAVVDADLHSLTSQIINGSGDGAKLDEYITQHSNVSPLLKVGGEPLIVARRLIVSALIRHSGVISLCKAEIDCIVRGKRNEPDSRPNAILVDVWKASQRIIENLVRQRQKTGFTYAAISKSICTKAELLLNLLPSDSCNAVAESLAMFASEIVSRDAATPSDTDSDIQKDCSKLISDVIDFLTCAIRNVEDLKSAVFQNTAKALLRTAGFKSISLLLQKVDAPSRMKDVTVLAPLSLLNLQPIVMEYVLLSLYGYYDLSSILSNAKPWSIMPSSIVKADDLTAGHYMNDLSAISHETKKALRESFESVYEYNTHLLSRCTWFGDRDGQYLALSAWGIIISPSDHIFLNRVGIFRVLQTVLDDVRGAIVDIPKKSGDGTSAADGDSTTNSRGPFAAAMVLSSIRRLSQLALRIVHSLAAQVAFTKDTTSTLSQVAVPKLIRMPSGPDTLSASLFEMLYSELFGGMKRIIASTLSKGGGLASDVKAEDNVWQEKSSEDDSLDGEPHIDRILKLLFFVSTSKSCHKTLSSAKWLSLLVASLGCGTMPIQRRVFRLLRRIISNMHPDNVKAYIPGFFSAREEILTSESCLDDADFESFAENIDEMDANEGHILFEDDSFMSPADRLIVLLLEGISVVSPASELSDTPTESEVRYRQLLNYYREEKLTAFVSAESLVFLRVLLGIPSWRKHIFAIVLQVIQVGLSNDQAALSENNWQRSQYLMLLTAAFGVCGGYVDRLRPGGIVTLKPFTLAGMTDSFANKLASTIHNTGMMICQSALGDSVEVVLMERGMRYVKPNESNLSGQQSSEADGKTIHFTTSVNGSLPVRAVRLNANDLFPSYDVPLVAETIAKEFFTDGVVHVLEYDVVPWMKSFLKNHKPSMSSNFVVRRTMNEPDSNIGMRRIHEAEVVEREMGDSENEDNVDEDVDVGSDDDDDDEQEKEDDYDQASDQQLFLDHEEGRSSIVSEPGDITASTKLRSDSQTDNIVSSSGGDCIETLKLHVRVSCLRSFSTSLLNDSLGTKLIENNINLFQSLLRLSIVETQCGGLGVIESVEEKWALYWDAYCNSAEPSKAKAVTASGVVEEKKSTRPLVSEDSESQSQAVRRETEERQGTLAESSPFAPFILGRSIDPAARAEAISQMMDMGLPREWCETSLRRCRYNIEMAINMCFEHGEDMSRFVAEDAALLAVQSSRDRDRERERERDREREGSNWRRRALVPEDPLLSSSTSTSASIASLTRALSRSRAYRQDISESTASARQLLDMGFPPNWCTRAMEESGNDVGGALAWILSHSEDLAGAMADERERTQSPRENVSSPSDESDIDKFNPLESVSGLANITPDLLCTVAEDGFPSVGCRGFAVSSGKWYFEVTLHSSGCIQIGWVDTAYVGAADSGQGVGDDIHSWAYDGWRTYLWHEISTPWGARWTAGDVIGCMLDLDNRIMSFTLNGLTEEIDMGVAFTDFQFEGGLYPCASFNKREKVQFNFGGNPFKFPIPPGYMRYMQHINNVRNQNVNLSKIVRNDIFRNAVLGAYSQSSNGKNQSISMFENALEESIGEKHGNTIRRYFPEESGRNIGSERSIKLASANISSAIPTDRKKIYAQLSMIAKDLCILYARQSVLRLVQTYAKLSESSRIQLSAFFSDTDLKFAKDALSFSVPMIPQQEENLGLTSFETLLFLMKLNGVHTNRTKIYLHTLGLSPASITPHHLLGSFTSVGGAPFYDALRGAMTQLVRQSRIQNESKHIVEALVQAVFFDCVNSIRRNQSFDYRSEGGLSPSQLMTDNVTSNATILASNSLCMATWSTNILIEQFAYEISNCSSIPGYQEEVVADIGHWLNELTEAWSVALRSPSILVKTCAAEMLSSLIQEHSYSSTRFVALPKSFVVDMLSKVPLHRIRSLVMARLNIERLTLPICSEYLQSLVELFVSLSHCMVHVHDDMIHESSSRQNLIDDYDVELPQLEMKCDLESSDFNWEACSGRLFSDVDSLIVWTGSLIQDEVSNLPSADRRSTDRTDYPPELMKGCRVSRKVVNKIPPKVEETQLPEAVSKEIEESSTSVLVVAPESEPSESIPRLMDEDPSNQSNRFYDRLKAATQVTREGSSRLTSNDESNQSKEVTEVVELGTVLEVCAWENDLPGTARLIQWDDGNVETVRWGAGGRYYDVSHAKMVNGKITGEYPRPILRDAKVVNQYFGSKMNFGIILRIRNIPREKSDAANVFSRIIGLMEWPDFGAIVYVEGFCLSDGAWTITEKKLVSGPDSANWSVRFGENKYQPGTTYKISRSSFVSDPTDEFCHAVIGSFNYAVNLPYVKCRISGALSLQRARLFHFDEKFHSSNVSPSWDRLSVTKSNSGSGQGSAFGSIGFSTGVHYWEFKVEQAEVGSVFIGVSEKPGPPGLSSSSKCTRWMGYGFVSHRASYRAASTNSSERVAVYGDYFHTGDIIGVLLDMNKGRLSFFLDGMKYGEHTVADLGEAFDGLVSPARVKPKVLYPVVGLSRHQDRVTITPRWLSSIGCHPEEELRIISRAWRLLASWSIDRPTSKPSDMNLWAYRDAWRDWKRWLSGKYLRVRSRCKSSSILVDISPEACVKASIRLGLPTALFHGDRVSFEKSSGRKLETKEEAVILGVYQGQLWFRHDSQQSSASLSESTAVAWSLAQNDVEGLSIIRRSMIQYPFVLPAGVVEILLPRIKPFRGGMVTLTLSSGAAMRNGLEIDTSDMIREIAANTSLYSIETRLNSSNITRHKVLYSGAIGWISERMRGGAEEVIISRQLPVDEEATIAARDEVAREVADLGAPDRIVWDDVDTIEEAMSIWRNKVIALGYGHLIENEGLLSSNPIAYRPPCVKGADQFSLENYLQLATTIDGHRNWIVEADMQLAEVLTKTAAKYAVTPQNLSSHLLAESIRLIDNASSQLYHIDVNRAIARASVLRVANQVIGYALPYLDLTLPEERVRRDVSGSDDEIEISTSTIPQPSDPSVRAATSAAVHVPADLNEMNTSMSKSWLPPTWARRLRSMRRILFGQTKRMFWESVIESTTTFTPLHQDEYEDPREIKTISINRIKATPSKLMTYSNIHERLKQSVFGQLHKELRNWSDASFRRSYVGKGHGGQKRSFKVKFMGEGVNDYGGPYRAVFEQVVDELQCDRSIKSSEKSLLPLLIPSNNRAASVGSIQDKFVLSTSPTTSPAILELMHFFGKLLGSAVRQNLNLALDLSAMVWRPLVRLPVSRAHLETVDSLVAKSLEDITKKGLQLEQDPSNYPPSYIPDDWEDFSFMIYLPDGTRIPLLPGGEDQKVNLGNWRLFVTLTERCRLRESVVMLKALRDGLSTVLPIDLLPLFTPNEFEQIISGSSNVDISLLRQCTEYEDLSADDTLVKNFWQVLEEFTPEDRTLFLRFVWARSRMPSSAEDLLMNFKLQLAQGDARSKPDQYLPHAQTCFFSLSLPPYSSQEIMKEKLLYAIYNSPNMDADVRLHHAEGWADA